jgi:tRNA(Ile)-lysidine synthase
MRHYPWRDSSAGQSSGIIIHVSGVRIPLPLPDMMAASLNLPARFRAFVQRHALIESHDRVLVAVSGGIDSAVLLHLLAGERTRSHYALLVAHFNHRLRGAASDADEAFVRQLAAEYGLPFFAGRAEVGAIAASRGSGIEEAARAQRYSFLAHLLAEHSCTRCATGHNADDNTETVLFHLFRGSGLRGLAGIPVSRNNGTIVRPLLFASRSEIAAYATAAGIRFREDASNATDDHTRNIIRHHILPVVRERIQPDLARTVMRTSALVRDADAFVTEIARTGLGTILTRRTGEEVLLPLSLLSSQPDAVRSAMIIEAIADVTGMRPGFEITQRVLALARARTGARAYLQNGWCAAKVHAGIRIGRLPATASYSAPVECNVPITVRGGTLLCVPVPRAMFDEVPRQPGEYVDAGLTGLTGLQVRSWQKGDALIPLGMRRRKKLSDLFIDARVAAPDRHRTPVLTTADGRIVWVCGLRIDDRFKITASTTDVLRLQFQRENS